MTFKVLNILKDDKVLQVYISAKDEIFISIEDQSEQSHPETLQFISLDMGDAIDLRDELDKLISQMV